MKVIGGQNITTKVYKNPEWYNTFIKKQDQKRDFFNRIEEIY